MEKNIYFTNGYISDMAKSDKKHNHTHQNVHQVLMQNLDKEQLEGSSFVFLCIDDIRIVQSQ